MKRSAVLLVSLFLLALVPTVVAAQGLLGGGLSGLPFVGGFLRGPAAGTCDEAPFPRAVTEAYVGYMDHRPGASFGFSTGGPGLLNAFEVRHEYPLRGVWLGLSETVALNEQIGLFASGWYLLPSNFTSEEFYNLDTAHRRWNTDTQWWFVEGLGSVRIADGFSLLGGLRYDRYTTRFKDPYDAIGVLSLGSDTADVMADNWIPLAGAQVACIGTESKLIFRAVGFPVLLGNIKYNQAFAGLTAFEARGNYRNGYFLEFFAQYARKFGPGQVGIFGRWNGTHGTVNLDVDALPAAGNAEFDLSFHRFSWTLGASVSLALNFNAPFM